MKLLLDTHVFLSLVELGSVKLPNPMTVALMAMDAEKYVSVASLWEIAIKNRLGKLEIGMPLDSIPELCIAASTTVLSITARHVLAEVIPMPPTRDPFDRLLLAQAAAEGLKLVTLDGSLASHPLAWRP